MSDEHHLKDTPYLVMDAGKKSWGAHCVCGWRSTLYDTQEELMEVVRAHMENPGKPPKKKKWWQKQPYDYDERRRS